MHKTNKCICLYPFYWIKVPMGAYTFWTQNKNKWQNYDFLKFEIFDLIWRGFLGFVNLFFLDCIGRVFFSDWNYLQFEFFNVHMTYLKLKISKFENYLKSAKKNKKNHLFSLFKHFLQGIISWRNLSSSEKSKKFIENLTKKFLWIFWNLTGLRFCLNQQKWIPK